MPERRAARRNFWPAACVELQTTAKPRTVGRVSGGQFARSPRRSRVRAEYRAHAARPVSSRRGNRPPCADWAPHVASPPACQPAAARPTPMAPPERTAALGASTRAGMPPDRWRRPPERRPWSSKSPIGTRLSPLHFLGGGWRAARGRPAGAASLWPRSFLTRPPGRAAGPPRRRCRSSRCAALPPTRTGVLCAGAAASPPRPPPCRLRRWLVGAARRGEMLHLSGVRTATLGRCRSSDNAQQSASVAVCSSSSAHPCIPDAFPECFVELAFKPAWISLLTPWISPCRF